MLEKIDKIDIQEYSEKERKTHTQIERYRERKIDQLYIGNRTVVYRK